jgi:hypothetical protein
MIDSNIKEKLRERYPDIHPLIFYRSMERSKTNGQLFDVLDTIPDKFPIAWCEESNCWIVVKDPYLFDDFNEVGQ